MTDWKTIRVPADVYEDAKARKEDHGVTWGQYLNPHAWHSVFDEPTDEPLSDRLKVECDAEAIDYAEIERRCERAVETALPNR
jgi:hypothetical protein